MNALGRLFAVCCCLLVVGTLAGAAMVGAGTAHPNGPTATAGDSATVATDSPMTSPSQDRQSWADLAQEDIDADTVSLVVDITESGDAEWQVVYRLRLETDADREAFADLQADIETNTSTYLDPFEQRIRETVGTASDATGREMSASNFAVSTERDEQPQGEFGLVTFSYEWAGFAVAEGGEIRAGDAVDQLFLDEDERIEFRWPEAYTLSSSSPEPAVSENQRAVYEGRFSFDAGQPRLVLTDDGDSGSSSMLLVLAVGLVVVVAGAGLLWWRRQTDEETGVADTPTATAEGGGTAASTADDDAGTTPSEPAPQADEGPPPELLSNEERVLQLLEQNGGRMKQKAVADQLEWSAAKTSQVVGDLRDEDRVESFRLGRENVLTLPDVDIDESLSEDDGDDESEQ